MKTVDEGVFIFNNWFESAKILSGLEFKKLFLAIYEYQINGIEPPSFTPKGEGIARNVFPHIEKRIKGAIYAKRGYKDNFASYPARQPDRLNAPTPCTKEKNRQDKNITSSLEEDRKWQEFFDAAIEHAFKKAAPTDEPSAHGENN